MDTFPCGLCIECIWIHELEDALVADREVPAAVLAVDPVAFLGKRCMSWLGAFQDV
jgi:hypothetical protein